MGELRSQLPAPGVAIEPATDYGPFIVVAVRASCEPFGLPAIDDVDVPTGRLMQVAATFAEGGHRAELRTTVREAAAATDNS